MSITDYQYQTAAQVIDQRTAVGLARIPNVDLRFFLPPPVLPRKDDVGRYNPNISRAYLLLMLHF